MPDEFRFYHVKQRSVVQTLPFLLEKIASSGLKAHVCLPENYNLKDASEQIWSYKPDGFLAHGYEGANDLGSSETNSLWLSHDLIAEGVTADCLLLCNRAVDIKVLQKADCKMACILFQDDKRLLPEIRQLWKKLDETTTDKEKLTYWQQTPNGGWEKKQ